MLRRRVAGLIRDRLAAFPAVALVGPRQCGKTTLAKTLAKPYFDLEQPEERVRLDLQWNDLMGRNDRLVLDEAQQWPELITNLRTR
jgi:predicted AAA+ superfamily ATPase